MCGGCPGLTWKRVANISGEVSPLVWLGGGTGDLGPREGSRVRDLLQGHKTPEHSPVLGPQLGPVGQVTAASPARPH